MSDGELAHGLLDLGRLRSAHGPQEPPRRLPREEGGTPHLEGDSGSRQRLFEPVGAGVRPVKNGDLVERDAGRRQLANPLHDESRLRGALDAPCHGVGPARLHCLETLLDAAEDGNEPVRKLEHLRGRAVVRLEPDDGRMPEAARHPD